MNRHVASWLIAGLMILSAPARADDPKRIGSVDTTFKLLGRNDRIVVERYDDPRVEGVSCYVSRAETGGISGSLGLATDPNRFSIACRATGPVTMRGKLPDREVVFGAAANPLFKEIRVTRMFDADKQVYDLPGLVDDHPCPRRQRLQQHHGCSNRVASGPVTGGAVTGGTVSGAPMAARPQPFRAVIPQRGDPR